jgi:hypothetical protein
MIQREFLIVCGPAQLLKDVVRVYEHNVQRNMLSLMGEGETRGLRKVRNEELRNIYSSSYITMTMKFREMRWVECLTRLVTEMRTKY